MTKHSRLSVVESTGIDAIIDSVVADPGNAAQAKSLLRERARVQDAIASYPALSEVANDDEDMWDNMPV